MNIFVFFFSMTLLTSSLTVTYAEGCGPLEEIEKEIDFKYVAREYYLEDQLADFWELHKRFGFIRYHNDRIYLITRKSDVKLREQIVEDLQAYNPGKEGKVETVNIPELANEHALDVTDILTKTILQLHGRTVNGNGPNCFNFCLIGKVTNGTMRMTEPEFQNWINSPFAQKIEKREDMQPGDIMVFKNLKENSPFAHPEVHGAIYISERLAAMKGDMSETSMHRIVDIQETIRDYYPKWTNVIDIYRVARVADVIKKHRDQMSPELIWLYDKAFNMERSLTDAFVESPTFMSQSVRDIFKQEFKEFAKELEQKADANLKRLQSSGKQNEAHLIELTLWNGLKFKAQDYRLTRI